MLTAFVAMLLMARLPPDTLTDAGLVTYASQFRAPLDRWPKPPKDGFLGIHNGARVLIEVRCSDVCPDETRMVIHYDIEPGPQCSRIGGAEAHVLVPFAIAVVDKTFCVPRILVAKRLYSEP